MKKFLEIEPEHSSYQSSKFVIIPCPYEKTTSYGKGTKDGPAAILAASQHVENFDEERGLETYRQVGITTLKPVLNNQLHITVERCLQDKKIPIIIGGEHSLTPLAVKAIKGSVRELSVLQLDAHADLRDTYQGKKNSHACVMRRILEICPAVQVGIRSISLEEWKWAEKNGQLAKIHYANKIGNYLEQLSQNVYITIDADVFDPAAVPAVGTPEPGGLLWPEVISILKDVCAKKNVVGLDVVELSPRRDELASPFTLAKLIYKVIGFLSSNQ